MALSQIAGREAVTSWMSVEGFQNARGPKELHWIDGASHVDLYDKDQYVTPAVAKLVHDNQAALALEHAHKLAQLNKGADR